MARPRAILRGVNPDADTTRIVRAEAFERRVAALRARGVDRDVAEVWVGCEEPHLARAWEELQHPRAVADDRPPLGGSGWRVAADAPSARGSRPGSGWAAKGATPVAAGLGTFCSGTEPGAGAAPQWSEETT